MIRCECCRAPIAEPVIETIAGPFRPGFGLCRGCWRLVGYGRRRELVAVRLAFRAQPGLEGAVMFYWLWQLAVSEAVFRSGRAAA